MVATRANQSAILSPEEVGQLVVQPLIAESVAGRVLTTVETDSSQYRIPVVTADPAAAWSAEGAELAAGEIETEEVDVVPSKLAGLAIVTTELANDSSPQALQVVGEGLTRDLTRKLDEALFSASTPNGPSGIPSLTGVQTVDAGTTYSNIDAFSDSIFMAADVNATITAFVTNPATAMVLAKVKEQTGSSKPLLGADATQPGQRQILGIPLLTSPYVDTTDSTVWAISQAYSYLIVREGAEVVSDASVFFSSDRVAIRAKVRCGFGFPHPKSIVKISLTP